MSRGKQRNPTFVHINIRVSKEVNDYFARHGNRSEAIRKVLDDYVSQQPAVDNNPVDDRQLMLPV